MLSKSDAKELLEFKYPGIRVESGIGFDDDFWVFRAFLPLGGGEENMNPFHSVNKVTGATNDFSVMSCGDPMRVMRLFAIEDGQNGSGKEVS